MDFGGVLRADQIRVLSTAYLVALTPSIIGSFSVLVVSIARWKRLQEQVLPLVQLALADLLAALILTFTSAMNTAVESKYSVTICQYALPLSLTFCLVSFLLLVVYAWKSQNAMRGWRARQVDSEGPQSLCERTRGRLPLYTIVWLVPVALYLAYVLTPFLTTALLLPNSDYTENNVAINESTYCTSCILFLHIWSDPCSKTELIHDIFIRVFLFLAVIPVLVSCSVIYYKVSRWYHTQEQQGLFPVEGDGRSRRRVKRMYSTARNMVLVILFCWTPALTLIMVSSLTRWGNIQQYRLFGLYILQAITVSLQGFLNSMVYAWRRPNFLDAVLGESTPLMVHGRQAFFDESLSSSV